MITKKPYGRPQLEEFDPDRYHEELIYNIPSFGSLDGEEVERAILIDKVQEILVGLSNEDREIFNLLFVQGMTPTEVALTFSMSYHTVIARRDKLFEGIKEAFGGIDPTARPMGSNERNRVPDPVIRVPNKRKN